MGRMLDEVMAALRRERHARIVVRDREQKADVESLAYPRQVTGMALRRAHLGDASAAREPAARS